MKSIGGNAADLPHTPALPPPPTCGSAWGLGRAGNRVDQAPRTWVRAGKGGGEVGAPGRARDGREEEGEKEEVDRVGEERAKWKERRVRNNKARA